ncbi:phosphatidylserine decarboxylase [bacterium]|nr:phosphatidylserine decarboxylase [bacterium]MBU1434887.1 phosphatidylserine decarboxylase [bacterium]MBU1503992.1 phosphatidylserine decarboxylase [bacterium]
MRNNLLPVLKEGWNFIAWAFALFVIFALLDCEILEFLSFVAFAALIYLYRNPERELPLFQNSSVTSPVDGTVLSIEELEDSEYGYKIEIESDFSNVAVLRVPMSSVLNEIKHVQGTRLSKKSPLFSKTNENTRLVFENIDGNKVKIVHTCKQSFDGIHTDIIKAQNLPQSYRYGTMINGITTLYLPRNFRLNINVANELSASETLIGYFS